MKSIKISHPDKKIKASIHLPGSKSESNRLLILNALSGNKLQIQNLSNARDTQNLVKILAQQADVADVLDAGTSMRFLTAYYCLQNKPVLITGSARMKERPIAPLVSALIEMGFDIRYKEKEGYPPLQIVPVNLDKIDSEAFVAGDVSSQFITALLLIAPFLPKGLKINFTTAPVSMPYIEMTLQLLEHFGVKYSKSEKAVEVHAGFNLGDGTYTVGGDWSSASYWYEIAFLADEAEIFLEGLKNDWSQGDQAVADWMKRFGISTEFIVNGTLIKKQNTSFPSLMKMNFTDNPDLAQTFAAMFGGKNIVATFTGIDSLKIKETDRINALQQELKKVNVHFVYSDRYEFYQLKGEYQAPQTSIETYKDHRMAMSFAPLALVAPIEIQSPEVVEKSYPTFWKDLEKAGFKIDNEVWDLLPPSLEFDSC
jgi:3-phosphoshikimate 1-carboxyvinyltransferase